MALLQELAASTRLGNNKSSSFKDDHKPKETMIALSEGRNSLIKQQENL